MRSTSVIAFLATSLLASTGAAVTENPAIAFGTFTDRCSSGQRDFQNPDDGCHGLPGKGMKVWWLAETCRGK